MTTREENLKKIRAELEQLSDDELEQVAGGSIPQTEDKNYKAHEDAIKKIPPITIIPIPMIPITQPISPPKI